MISKTSIGSLYFQVPRIGLLRVILINAYKLDIACRQLCCAGYLYLIKRSTKSVFIKKFALTQRIRSIISYAEKSQNCFGFPQAGWLEVKVIYNYNASKLRIA